MDIDPGQAIQELLKAFEESRTRVQNLEDTLAAEREAAAVVAAERAEEQEQHNHLREKYEALKTTQRELKRALSETNAAQAQLVADTEAYQEHALELTEAKAGVDKALRDLQARYEDLKLKKTRKTNNSSEIESLTAEVGRLTVELAKATKQKRCAEESYRKLDKLYNEELELSDGFSKRYDQLSVTNKEVMKKYIALEKESSTLKEVLNFFLKTRRHSKHSQMCDDLKARNLKLREECRTLQTRKDETEKTCIEVIGAAEKIHKDDAQLRATIDTLRTITEALWNRVQNGRVPTAVARILYDAYMDALPSSIHERPDFWSLQPIAKIDTNLRDLLASDPVCEGFLERLVYLPMRTVWCSAARLHVLAFNPTHRYHPKRDSWTLAPDICVGPWRELFLDVEDSIFYVGTYRVHDLRHLCPGGTPAPAAISTLKIYHAANLGTLEPDERTKVIKNGFPSGILDTNCMGLECVGFNHVLYDSLLRRSSGTKREVQETEPEEWGTDAKRLRMGSEEV
ncbi:hypothetical protein MVEN_02387800 [Mycena venus]|uniref:Uncharacterized protein n=1 Tax=Mycena venus TaxID=2733690 RepID=A0A8H7CD54_9AGAR|nr:hypothetical protein MVEN_02387800 [Mycena venus]